MSIKSIVNFIRDERGAESVEFGVTSVVVAAGAVKGLQQVNGAVKGKQATMVASLNDPANNPE
jgi:Flp pilus assembly pilin Flp